MKTDFKQSPYFDDYLDSVETETNTSVHTKNFHRILFKPGVAVQARELTQSQSILQDQIKKFGDHIFENYTQVYGAELTYNDSVKFLKLESLDINNQGIELNNFINKTVVSEDEKISAKVLHVIEGPTNIIIVAYNSAFEFYKNQFIYVQGTEYTARILNTDLEEVTGPASICSIERGVFYIDGYFVEVNKQTIAVDVFSNSPTARVGLRIVEDIVSSDEDTSLLDPALGASNFQAPGADRFKISLQLAIKPLELDEDDAFIELVRLYEGKILKSAKYTDYSELDKYFARRTMDTNGNFIVNKFNINVQENVSNSNTFFVKIGPGKAYVNGFIVENQSDKFFISNKSREFFTSNNKSIFMNYGNYVYVDNIRGWFDFNSFEKYDIHCTKTANTNFENAYSATLAGTARIKNMKFSFAQDFNQANTYTYETYLVDVQTKEYKGVSVSPHRELASSTTPASVYFPQHFSSANGAYDGVFLKINSGNDSGDYFQIVSYEGGAVKKAVLNKDFINDPGTNIDFSLIFEPKDFESLYNSNTSGGIITTNNSFALINNISKTPSNDVGYVSLRNTNDDGLIYELGNEYVVENSVLNSEYTTWMRMGLIPKGTTVSLPKPDSILAFSFTNNDGTYTFADAAENFICVHSSGNLVSFGTTSANVVITNSATTPTMLLNDPNNAGGTYNIYAKVKVNNGNILGSTKRRKTLVSGNTEIISSFTSVVSGKNNTYIDLSLGQLLVGVEEFDTIKQSLYVSDAIRIKRIVDTEKTVKGDVNVTDLLNPDISRNFVFNNGQTDNYYDHSSLKQYSGAPNVKGYLLIVFDFYQHVGNGYFDNYSYVVSGGSYSSIPFYVNSKGKRFELRDCIDFRPSRVNGTTTFALNELSGQFPTKITVDGTAFETDYSYYLKRKDLLVIGKDNDFKLIEGVPSLNPVEPNQPDGSMSIASFDLDPYTMRITSDARGSLYSNIRIKTMIHKRWRMEDITTLEDRVSRVEYYTSLNTLEISALKIQIPDETGLNRFKNGILVDDFSNYIVADIGKEDYYASVQPAKSRLYSIHKVNNYDLTIKDAINTLGRYQPSSLTALDYAVNYDGDDAYLTLPYEKVTAAFQPYASDVINVNPFNVISKQGKLDITPKFDAWVDVNILPEINYEFPVIQTENVNRITYGDYQTIKGADQKSAGSNTIIQVRGDLEDFDGFVTDVRLNPWIREQQLTFVASGLLKNTFVNAYFDKENVTNRIRECNTIKIRTSNTAGFTAGDILSTSEISGKQIAKILYTSISNTQISGESTTYDIDCELIGDLGTSSYTAISSNTIYSVYLNESGVSSSAKGQGEVISVEKNSGIILSKVAASRTANSNTVIIQKTHSQQANSIYEGSYLYVIDQLTNEINENQISRAVEDSTNNQIHIFCTNDIVGLDDFTNNPSVFTNTDRQKIYSIKFGNHIKTNRSGTVGGIFYLPANKYHTGDRVFRIDNRIAENEGTESTFCETVFFASNLNYDKRNVVIDVPIQIIPPPPPPSPPACPPIESRDGYLDTLPEGYVTTGWRIRWKYSNATQRRRFNNEVKSSYPVEIDEFDTDTIVLMPENALSFAFSQAFTVIKTYIISNPNCAVKTKVITYHDPVAQTFILFKEEYPYGAFIKSIKTFFKSKPEGSNEPISCWLSETVNGIPTKAEIPHSYAELPANKVKTTLEPSIYDEETWTEFEFPVPVYLKPETLYSFILKSSSDEYEVYTARLGDFALPSTTKNSKEDVPKESKKIDKTPYIGELFKSQNLLTWTSEPNDDIMFVMERCNFDITSNPKIEFVVPKYLPQRKLGDRAIEFISDAEANLAIGVCGTTTDPFVVDAFNVSTTDLTFTESPINYSYSATLKGNITTKTPEVYISPAKYGSTNFEEIMLDDNRGERILLPNTVNDAYTFSLYADMRSSDPTISPMISEVGLSLFAVKYYINNLGISNTDIKIVNGGTGYANDTVGSSVSVIRTSNNVVGNTIIGLPCRIGYTCNSAGTIDNVWVIESGSEYASSPIIQINDGNRAENSNASVIIVGETSSIGGNGLTRYITKPVTLTQDFDAGDLRVYYTAYRPINTNIYIYYKILSRNDNQSFDDSDWQLMTTISGRSTFSKRRGDLYEYVAAPYDNANPGIASNRVSYVSKENGQVYTSFSKFAIKVVTSSPDPTFVPYLEDIRAIALLPIGL